MFAKLCSAALVLALLVPSSVAADCARTYTIQPGDYCDKISASQKASTFQLAAVNSGVIDERCGNLVPGKDLCLGSKGEDCTDVYVVKADDTCEAIASAHNTNTTILRFNNPQINDHCDNIYIGEVLCVAGSVTVPPIPSGGVVVPIAGPPAVPDAPVPPPTTVTATPSGPPVPAATIKSAPAPAAPVADNGDDADDCDDDDGDDDSTPTSAVSPAPTSTSSAQPTGSAAAPAPPASDDDDDDLPFCDELEDQDY